jgi:hypothetical protein
MSSKAFWLLAFVIGTQLTLSAAVVVDCIVTDNIECTGGKVAKGLESIVAQCFALYAAEVSLNSTRKH